MDLLLFFSTKSLNCPAFLKTYGQHGFNRSIPALPGGVS